MTDIFEGSVIRLVRRVDEFLNQIAYPKVTMRSSKEQLISLRAVAILLVLLAYALKAKSLLDDSPTSNKDSPMPNKARKDNAEQSSVFDVTNYGAEANGHLRIDKDTKDDLNVMAFVKVWTIACQTEKPTIVLIPPGDYVFGPVSFVGGCKSQMKVDNRGNLSASTDISTYHDGHWIQFKDVSGLIFTGAGEINGHGSKNWKRRDCKTDEHCPRLPTSIMLDTVRDTIIDGIVSKDSMFFHMFLSNSQNVTIRRVMLVAPDHSPNTDGIHTRRSRLVKIYDSNIGTGDDCISIGEGSVDIDVHNITCGPGHGLSIGSIGENDGENNVQGITMKNCTLTKTDNGVRIKTYGGSVRTTVQHIIFENIAMDSVKNPIVIDSAYSNNHHKVGQGPSHVKLTNITFSNIHGTSATEDIVSLNCSAAVPCSQISLKNIQLRPPSEKRPIMICKNATCLSLNCSAVVPCT